jgi:putative drug exporter of the RND superfamily
VTLVQDIERPGHVPSSPPDPRALFSRLAAFSARRRRGVMLLWLLVALAAAPLALTLTGALSGAGWEAQGSTAQHVRDELRRDFPQLDAAAPVVVYHQPTAIASEPAALQALVARLQHAPRAAAVGNPLALPASAGLISPDGRTAIVPVSQVVHNDAERPMAAGELGSYVKKLNLAPGARAEVTGEWPVWSDFNKINAEALHKAELLSGLPSIILLFVAFGVLIAAGLPLVLALAGIVVGFALLHILGWVTPMSIWSMNSR